MNIRRCFWRDLFAHHDARLVTTVMGSWDTNWMRAIDPAVSELRAECTSLLSLGDDQCRFAVAETDDPSPATPTRSGSDSLPGRNPADGCAASRRYGGPAGGQEPKARGGAMDCGHPRAGRVYDGG
jgi:hypothetical protein